MTEKQRHKRARSGQSTRSSALPPAAPDATCVEPRSCAGGDGGAELPGPQHRYRPAVPAPVSPLLLCPLPSLCCCSPFSRTPRRRERSGFRGGKRQELLLPRPRRQVSPGPQTSGSRVRSAPRSLALPSSRAPRASRSRPAASGRAAMRRSEPLRRRCRHRPPFPGPPRRRRRGPTAGPPARPAHAAAPAAAPRNGGAARHARPGTAARPDAAGPLPAAGLPAAALDARAHGGQLAGKFAGNFSSGSRGGRRGDAGHRSRSGGRARPGPPRRGSAGSRCAPGGASGARRSNRCAACGRGCAPRRAALPDGALVLSAPAAVAPCGCARPSCRGAGWRLAGRSVALREPFPALGPSPPVLWLRMEACVSDSFFSD